VARAISARYVAVVASIGSAAHGDRPALALALRARERAERDERNAREWNRLAHQVEAL
jgi:hypothetical protein